MLASTLVYSQYVGVNTDAPQSTLDVKAKDAALATQTQIDGILVPRVSKARAEAMGTAVPNANLIFVDALTAPATIATTARVTAIGFYYYDAAQSLWIPNNFSDNDWHTTGNSGTTVGTNYLGTNDAQPLMFKVNAVQSGYIDYDLSKRNTGFGYNTLTNALSAANNNANTAVGYEALNKIGTVAGTWQTQNVAVGDGAMKNLVGGAWNTAVGANAMGSATGDPNTLSTMRNNVALGISALASINNGSFNLAIGPNTMSQAKTIVPTDAISSNIAMGLVALDVLNNGSSNIALGFYAAKDFKNGSNNVFIGAQPALNAISGDQNIFIGHNATGTTTTSSNEINIGNVIKGTGSTNSAAPAVTKKIGVNLAGAVLPNATLQVNGSVSAKIRVLSAGTVAEDDYTVLVRGNITMPAAAATNAGRIYQLILDAAGSFTISGTFRMGGANSTNYVLSGSTNGTNVVVQSNGTDWVVISRD